MHPRLPEVADNQVQHFNVVVIGGGPAATDVARAVQQSLKKGNIDVKTGVNGTGHELAMVVRRPCRRPCTPRRSAWATRVAARRARLRPGGRTKPHPRTRCVVSRRVHRHAGLAHVGFEGIVPMKDVLNEESGAVDYGKVPWAIYCHPRSPSRD